LIFLWTALADKLHQTGRIILEKATSDPTTEKALALALLARTLSNLRSTISLLRDQQIVEARTITRCCFENAFWAVCLQEEGEAFVRKMEQHEISQTRRRGQSIFDNIALDAAAARMAAREQAFR
jgi:hypothetical protein